MAAPNDKELDENFLPKDFEVSYSSGKESLDVSTYLESCPLCLQSKRSFYCRKCVKLGFFEHSQPKGGCTAESETADRLQNCAFFCDRIQLLQEAKMEREALRRRLLGAAASRQLAAQKLKRMELLKARIDLMKRETSLLEKRLNEENERRLEAEREYRGLEEKVPKLKARSQKLRSKATRTEQHKAKADESRERHLEQLKEYRLRKIRDAIHLIFPVTKTTCSDCIAPSSKQWTALEEAQRMSYRDGEWIDTLSESMYKIVDSPVPESLSPSSLPNNNARYEPHSVATSGSPRFDGPSDEVAVDAMGEHNTLSALCHSAQLTNLLAYILDMPLPRNLPISKFYLDLSSAKQEKALGQYWSRLNLNLVVLCLSQGMAVASLDANNPVKSLYHLLNDTPTLGRVHSFQLADELDKYFPTDILGEESDNDEDNDICPGEYEIVASALEIPTETSQSMSRLKSGSIISSISGSISSLFGRHKDA